MLSSDLVAKKCNQDFKTKKINKVMLLTAEEVREHPGKMTRKRFQTFPKTGAVELFHPRKEEKTKAQILEIEMKIVASKEEKVAMTSEEEKKVDLLDSVEKVVTTLAEKKEASKEEK